jgi:hypothetical protein
MFIPVCMHYGAHMTTRSYASRAQEEERNGAGRQAGARAAAARRAATARLVPGSESSQRLAMK